MNTFRDWAIQKHRETNHLYDGVAYELHLKMVASTAEKFIYLISDSEKYDSHNVSDATSYRQTLIDAAWGHDLIEDTRVTYSEILSKSSHGVADIIYALTNEKGRNRKERANHNYYKGIRETKGAVYVKLCDRIANVSYSKMMGSSMLDMYKEENKEFMEKLGYHDSHELFEMFDFLRRIFEKGN